MGFLDYDETNRTYRPSIRVALLGTWVLGGSLPIPTHPASRSGNIRPLIPEYPAK
jgi:hypothetical protein